MIMSTALLAAIGIALAGDGDSFSTLEAPDPIADMVKRTTGSSMLNIAGLSSK
jgi:hypothetical protein